MKDNEIKIALELAYNAGKRHDEREKEINQMIDDGTKSCPEMPSFENFYSSWFGAQPVESNNIEDVFRSFIRSYHLTSKWEKFLNGLTELTDSENEMVDSLLKSDTEQSIFSNKVLIFKIVNHLYELAGVDSVKRQSINDDADKFLIKELIPILMKECVSFANWISDEGWIRDPFPRKEFNDDEIRYSNIATANLDTDEELSLKTGQELYAEFANQKNK